jgi:hypothetical protein
VCRIILTGENRNTEKKPSLVPHFLNIFPRWKVFEPNRDLRVQWSVPWNGLFEAEITVTFVASHTLQVGYNNEPVITLWENTFSLF